MKTNKILDMKYALTQVLYFGSFCALLGYASVYLLAQHVSNSVIGIVLALTSVIAVITQPMIASYADNHQEIKLSRIIVIFLIVAIALSISLFFLGHITMLLLCAFVGIVTCMMTIQPLLNSMAFMFEKHGIAINYGVARGLGSAAYALVSLTLGYMVEDFGASILPLVYIILNLLLTIAVYTFVLPKQYEKKDITKEKEDTVVQEDLSFLDFCKRYRMFMLFALGTVLVFFTHTVINNFFIQVITPIGGTESQMGIAVFIAAILELPAMSLFNIMREKAGCENLLKISAIAFLIKHVITFLAPGMMLIYVAQVTQIFAYAIFLPASVYYANEVIDQCDRIKGQSIVTASVTASGIIANLAGGFLLDAIGVHSLLFLGVIISVLGAIVIFISTNNKKVQDIPEHESC